MNNIKCTKVTKNFFQRLENTVKEIQFEGVDSGRNDEVAEMSVLLAKYMQYRQKIWSEIGLGYASVVDWTLKEFFQRSKISSNCYDNILLYLNNHWNHSRFLPVTPYMKK